MQDVVDWMRDRGLNIPHVLVRWHEGLPGTRLERVQPEATSPTTNPVRPRQRILHQTIVMIRLEEYRATEDTQTLERAGYEVRTVSRLSDALEAVRQGHPSLIIICSGVSVTRACLALRNATTAPILALLTAASEAELLAALDAGADDCQPATIGAQEVLMRARALLRRSTR